uniref:Uncharacterized protein n=1 Tax=Magallana gigas TaxID=29159 RepID=K1PWE7_MAGGI
MDSKKKAKLTLQAEAEKDLQAHVKKQANQARLRILKALELPGGFAPLGPQQGVALHPLGACSGPQTPD